MIYLLLDTSTPLCKATVVSDGTRHEYQWQADRALALGLLDYLRATLSRHEASFDMLDGIGVYAGPGSFTGLRIGLTVVNTIADSQGISIVGATGDAWRDEAIGRLQMGENDRLVMPVYGAEARITTPKK